jgi:hypothetical protein
MPKDTGFGYVAKTLSDAEGRFEIFDFPTDADGERGQLAFESPWMLRTVVEDIYRLKSSERKTMRIILRKGNELTGRVTAADGGPVGNLLIEAEPADSHAQHKETTTDADGKFALRGLPDGDVSVRAHSFALKQKITARQRLRGADAVVNLRLQPVTLKTPPQTVNLFGMKLAGITPALRAAYDLGDARGVLVLDPGPNVEQLGIGRLEEGNYFFVVGENTIDDVGRMVSEILRINEIAPPGKENEGCRDNVRLAYSTRHLSNTQRLKLGAAQIDELKKVAATLSSQTSAK